MKCDKLNAYKGDVTIPVYGSIADAQVYLKSEADKAIAELEESHKMEVGQLLMEIVELKEKYKELAELHDKAIQACCDADKVIAHHKYKRCLAMARWCHNESMWWYSKGYGFEKYDKFWEKWQKRCLKLAEQFKETK